MTRLFTDGAEFGDSLFWDSFSGAISSAYHRSGVYSYAVSSGNSDKSFTASSETYLRIPFNLGNSTNHNIMWRMLSAGGTEMECRFNNGTYKLEFYLSGTTKILTSSNAVSYASWVVLEVHWLINDTSGIFGIKINGLPDGDYSGDAKGTGSTIDTLRLCPNYGTNQYYDDLALNNTSGTSDTSWCGSGRVELLKPTAEGYTNQWSVSTGSTHWSLVDDIPPNNDTDYIYSSTANQIDAFGLEDFDSTDRTIKRVWAEVRAYDYGASAAQISLGFRTTEGTNYFSTTNNTLSGSYARHISDDFTTNPATSSTWQDADIDALQLLIKEVS